VPCLETAGASTNGTRCDAATKAEDELGNRSQITPAPVRRPARLSCLTCPQREKQGRHADEHILRKLYHHAGLHCRFSISEPAATTGFRSCRASRAAGAAHDLRECRSLDDPGMAIIIGTASHSAPATARRTIYVVALIAPQARWQRNTQIDTESRLHCGEFRHPHAVSCPASTRKTRRRPPPESWSVRRRLKDSRKTMRPEDDQAALDIELV
jgi:hypothetical protein